MEEGERTEKQVTQVCAEADRVSYSGQSLQNRVRVFGSNIHLGGDTHLGSFHVDHNVLWTLGIFHVLELICIYRQALTYCHV